MNTTIIFFDFKNIDDGEKIFCYYYYDYFAFTNYQLKLGFIAMKNFMYLLYFKCLLEIFFRFCAIL